jgi:hypothetical protein
MDEPKLALFLQEQQHKLVHSGPDRKATTLKCTPDVPGFFKISIGGAARIDVLGVHDALATIVAALQKTPMKSFNLLHWQYPERNCLPNICFEHGCTANTFPPQGLNTIMHPESTILVCISGENTVAIELAMSKIRKYLRENITCYEKAYPFHFLLVLSFLAQFNPDDLVDQTMERSNVITVRPIHYNLLIRRCILVFGCQGNCLRDFENEHSVVVKIEENRNDHDRVTLLGDEEAIVLQAVEHLRFLSDFRIKKQARIDRDHRLAAARTRRVARHRQQNHHSNRGSNRGSRSSGSSGSSGSSRPTPQGSPYSGHYVRHWYQGGHQLQQFQHRHQGSPTSFHRNKIVRSQEAALREAQAEHAEHRAAAVKNAQCLQNFSVDFINLLLPTIDAMTVCKHIEWLAQTTQCAIEVATTDCIQIGMRAVHIRGPAHLISRCYSQMYALLRDCNNNSGGGGYSNTHHQQYDYKNILQ